MYKMSITDGGQWDVSRRFLLSFKLLEVFLGFFDGFEVLVLSLQRVVRFLM